jgi:hypothetical protein
MRGEKGKILEGQYSDPIFPNIRRWHVTEKINGANMRVEFHVTVDNGAPFVSNVEIKGKTDDAQIPPHLLKYMQNTFTVEKIVKIVRVKRDEETGEFINESYDAVLYGEGYGPKIAKGHLYRDDVSLILFDVKMAEYWLEPENVKDIAHNLGIDYVPELGIMEEEQIISMVKAGYKSYAIKPSGNKDCCIAEGIVARSHPMVLFRDGTPVMWKLKERDYKTN